MLDNSWDTIVLNLLLVRRSVDTTGNWWCYSISMESPAFSQITLSHGWIIMKPLFIPIKCPSCAEIKCLGINQIYRFNLNLPRWGSKLWSLGFDLICGWAVVECLNSSINKDRCQVRVLCSSDSYLSIPVISKGPYTLNMFLLQSAAS